MKTGQNVERGEENRMKGVVEKSCDIDSIAIPEELLDIHVDEQ